MTFQDTVRQYAKAVVELGYAAYCFDFYGGSVIRGQSDGAEIEYKTIEGGGHGFLKKYGVIAIEMLKKFAK